MDIEKINDKLRRFAKERNWERYHTPKNLSTALSVEASGLVEIFQWLTDEESKAIKCDDVKLEMVKDELADIATYLIRIADVMNIDLENAIWSKLNKTAQKYKPGDNTPRSKHDMR